MSCFPRLKKSLRNDTLPYKLRTPAWLTALQFQWTDTPACSITAGLPWAAALHITYNPVNESPICLAPGMFLLGYELRFHECIRALLALQYTLVWFSPCTLCPQKSIEKGSKEETTSPCAVWRRTYLYNLSGACGVGGSVSPNINETLEVVSWVQMKTLKRQEFMLSSSFNLLTTATHESWYLLAFR